MIVSPSPTMKPAWTAVGMKRLRKPIFSHPNTASATPQPMASVADSAAKRSASPRASGAMMAAEMAAVDEVGLTTSWRDVPRIPYASSPPMVATSPACAGSPAIWAYAIA